MDTPKTLSRDEAIRLARRYKEVITPRFREHPKVVLFGSYAKGTPNPWSDIDVAVIVPKVEDDKWLETSVALGMAVDDISLRIEPILLEEHENTPIYHEVMRTGVLL